MEISVDYWFYFFSLTGLVGSPFHDHEKKSSGGKIEKNATSMLIVSLICASRWMPSLGLRIRSKVKWVQNENIAVEFVTPKQLLIQIFL